MRTLDWKEVETRLYEESLSSIKSFSAEYPDEEVCYFAFDSEPSYGYVLICFDTTENSASEAKRYAHRSAEHVNALIRDGCPWQVAKTIMMTAGQLPFTNNTGDFKYQGYREVNFDGWQEFAASEQYPRGGEEEADDYLEGNLVIIFWKVIDKLIRENRFSVLRMAAPFYVGYGLHDEDQVVLRIINW